MAFENHLNELQQRKRTALEMGGSERVSRQHDRGKLSARERIDLLVDPNSFFEIGLLNHSDMPGMEDRTPADAKVAGYASLNGRRVSIISNDFTVLAATTSRVAPGSWGPGAI